MTQQHIKNDLFPLVSLAVPLALTGLTQASVFFFETLFLAHVSTDALAAGALVSWFFGTFIVIMFGTLSSINILVAYHYGAKNNKKITQVTRDGILLAILLAIPSILLIWNLSPLFLIFGQSPSLALLAKDYLHALAWGILPNFIAVASLEFIMGLGHGKTILAFSTLNVACTIFFSFALIFGKLGMPALGIAGAGWGISISWWIYVFIIISYISINKKYHIYVLDIFKFQKPSYLIELFNLGIPMGLMYCVEVAFFFALTVIMGVFGKDLLAANQIVMQYFGTLMAIIFSIAQAITVRMGHLLGENKAYPAERAAYFGIIMAGGFVGICSIGFLFYPTALISLDLDIQDVNNLTIIHYAKEFFAINAIFMILEAIRISLFGALRGLKDTRFTLLVSIISFWCIALPLGYLLAKYFDLKGAGLWWGMVIGVMCSVLLLFWRFKSKIHSYYHKGC